MDAEPLKLSEPKFVEGSAMRVAGHRGEYTREQTGEIPRQWDAFNAALYRAEGLGVIDDSTLGVVYPLTPMRYVTGVAIRPEAAVPEGWIAVTVPAQRYAVFAETGGVPAIRRALVMIFSEWLPKSGRRPADGPMLERYPADWVTSGNFEIWIPMA